MGFWGFGVLGVKFFEAHEPIKNTCLLPFFSSVMEGFTKSASAFSQEYAEWKTEYQRFLTISKFKATCPFFSVLDTMFFKTPKPFFQNSYWLPL